MSTRVWVKVNLNCCKGCRDSLYKNLKRIQGVENVEIDVEEWMLVVIGRELDAEEILQKVKEKKASAELAAIELPEIPSKPKEEQPISIPLKPSKSVETEAEETCKPPKSVEIKPAEPMKPPKYTEAEAEPPIKPPKSGHISEKLPKSGNVPPPTALPPSKPAVRLGDTLVSERFYDESNGTKIRTRVTTTHDARTCILYEETRFFVDKCTAPAPA